MNREVNYFCTSSSIKNKSLGHEKYALSLSEGEIAALLLRSFLKAVVTKVQSSGQQQGVICITLLKKKDKGYDYNKWPWCVLTS